MALTPQKQKFAELILAGARTQVECYRLAYPKFKGKDATARNNAYRLAKDPDVAAMIEREREKTRELSRMTNADVTKIWETALLTDRNEIVELRRVACRHCWGAGHRYQERPSEREERKAAHDAKLAQIPVDRWKDLPQFDERGGLGYNATREPNPDCPECDGLGEERVHIHDTRKTSLAARMIYEGIEIKNGVPVIKIRSRSDVDSILAKALGLFAAKGSDAQQVIVYGSLSQSDAVDDSREPNNPRDADL